MNHNYPETISLEGETLDFLRNHSGLIETLYDIQGNEGSLELSADVLFQGDQDKWELFYDLFFPEEAVGKLFVVKNGAVVLNASRGGKEQLKDLMDYLLVETPSTMMNFAKRQAKKQINAPQNTVARIPRVKGKSVEARVNNAVNDFEFANNNYYNYNNNNNNNSNYNNTKLGYTEEEEEYLAKLKGSSAQKYYPNARRARNRKTRRSNRKSRKATRRNRN